MGGVSDTCACFGGGDGTFPNLSLIRSTREILTAIKKFHESIEVRQQRIRSHITSITSNLSDYIYVFNASFEEQSIHATTSMSYISPWLTYRF
jgi:hypothetical protein